MTNSLTLDSSSSLSAVSAQDVFSSLSSSSSSVSLVTSDGTYFYVESDGIALHNMMTGITAWNQRISLPHDFMGDNNFGLHLHRRLPMK
jgi:hypothetical protein